MQKNRNTEISRIIWRYSLEDHTTKLHDMKLTMRRLFVSVMLVL